MRQILIDPRKGSGVHESEQRQKGPGEIDTGSVIVRLDYSGVIHVQNLGTVHCLSETTQWILNWSPEIPLQTLYVRL